MLLLPGFHAGGGEGKDEKELAFASFARAGLVNLVLRPTEFRVAERGRGEEECGVRFPFLRKESGRRNGANTLPVVDFSSVIFSCETDKFPFGSARGAECEFEK